MRGKVYLVGAGPGDPDLLTVKAARLLRTADAVLHDDLVSPEMLDLIPPAAQRHNVGKRCGTKKIQQEQINFLMIALADSGLQVVRLKSGDPLIFGRAGEEIEALRHAGIEHEIVPGITSALGAAAAAQIPLTRRHMSSAISFITAQQVSGSDIDWSHWAVSGSTLVIYMPGHSYTALSVKLKAAGFPADLPCAIISQATTPRQRVHRTNIADLGHSPQLPAPTLLIVGEVVSFGHTALDETIAAASEAEFSLAAVAGGDSSLSRLDEEPFV